MRFEIKTSKGYLIVEDVDAAKVAIWFSEGETPAVIAEKKALRPLGEVAKSALRRLGRGV